MKKIFFFIIQILTIFSLNYFQTMHLLVSTLEPVFLISICSLPRARSGATSLVIPLMRLFRTLLLTYVITSWGLLTSLPFHVTPTFSHGKNQI